jgi:hypothetical protein
VNQSAVARRRTKGTKRASRSEAECSPAISLNDSTAFKEKTAVVSYSIHIAAKLVPRKFGERQVVERQLGERQVGEYYKCGNSANGKLSNEPGRQMASRLMNRTSNVEH